MIKQVIIIRKDLNMRKGKMIAQGAHASINAFLSKSWQEVDPARLLTPLDGPAGEWLDSGHTKITVSVDSEKELLALTAAAKEAGLPHALIKDAAHTEFKEPTFTALAIGPADEEEVNKITSELQPL